MKKQIIENVFYNSDFLKSTGTSDQFFKQIAYPVQLDGMNLNIIYLLIALYKIKDTCYYHEGFDFCPVMVEIIDQRLKDHYGGNFLMQVWDKQGEKCFEKTLQYNVHSWNVFTDHFVYRLHPDEAGSEWIFIHNMRKKAGYFKVKDFVKDDLSFKYLGVCNSCFYIGNNNTIKCIDINFILEEGGETILEPTDDQILTYQIGDQCKLHGFFENSFAKEQLYLICLVETEDNQIDFARLYFWSRVIATGDISFLQYTEVVHRDISLDPIVKYKQIVHASQFQFGLALRDSGKVDFYWNSTRVSTSEEFFVDIEINFQNIYLIRKDGTKFVVDTKWDTRVSMEVAEELQLSPKEWEKLFYRTIANNFKLYPSYCLINTSFFLANGNIISLFDIIKKEWVKHFFVEEKVLKVFRNEKSDHVYNLGAYLDNGRIKLIDSEDTTNPELWEMKLNKYGTKGTLVSYGCDMEHYRMLYIITNDEGTINLYGFTRETLYIFNTLVHELRADTVIVPFFSPANRTEFILYNSLEGDVRIYTHYWENNADGVLTFYLTLVKHCQMDTPKAITGKVHASMTTDKEKFIFLVDEKNFYKLNVQTKELKTYLDQNVIGLQFLDNTFCYTMTNKSSKRDEYGFYVYDIQQLLDQEKDNNFMLDRALVGVNGLIDFSEDNQRLSYMSDFDTVQIVPSLHRNVINFMGMLNRDQYLATKKMKDKFIALDKRNILTTWSAVTGKLEQVHKLKDVDLSTYDVYSYEKQDITYSMDWYQPKALLLQRDPLENITDDQYFDPEMLRTSLENNKPYIKIMAKKFHNFKLIEIVNEFEVKEHFTFIHPFYGIGKYQRIYLSDNNEYMLERLVNQRIFLYQRQKGMFGMVKWKMVRRLTQWPMDMSECTYANYLLSPDLMSYLDCDRKSNEFVIKETLTQKIKYQIPKGLMNPNEGKVIEYAKRFRWIDSSTIRLVNKEGIEKILDIEHQFKEIAFTSVPLFKEITDYKHYYYMRKPLALGDTLDRLKMKYQKFKAAYYLEHKREPWQIYDQLFDIDYSIDACSYKYVIDLSFTFLHWRLAETIKHQKDFSMEDIDNSQIELLVYNIFPWCNTAIHYAVMKQEVIKQIYSNSEKEGESFEVPFLNNLDSQSPMHICMLNKEFKTADLFLQKLANAPLDHHSRAVVSALPIAIDQGLESVGDYLTSRFKQTEQIKTIRRGCLNIKGSQEYAVTESQMWMDVKEIETTLFKESPVESDIRLEFFDLPKLHCYGNKSTDQLFDSLSNTENIELFSNRGIQTIIDYKWKLAKEYTIRKLFVPFLFFMIFYFIYSNFIFVERFHEETSNDGIYSNADYGFFVLGPLIILISSYFLVSEMRQLISTGPDYLMSIWNYFDIIPPIIIPLIIIQDFLGIRYDFQHTLHSVASLFMWFKFLYFLRIFKKTGYLIRMITEVIVDMKVFFIVLVIVLCAFADAFLSLSNANKEGEARFAGSDFFSALIYSYRTSLGDFQLDKFNDSVQSLTAWIIFLISSILVLIVMLNLLIAIISESFAKINSVADQASYQERARIISENCYLIPDDRQKAYADKYKYMLVAREVQVNEDKVSDSITDGLEQVKEYFNSRIETLEANFQKKLDDILAAVKK